jgi:hypothetical protein
MENVEPRPNREHRDLASWVVIEAAELPGICWAAADNVPTAEIMPLGAGRHVRSGDQADYVERAARAVLPDLAERVFAMAERQQRHRHELEKMTAEGASKRAWWGLWLGFVITIVVMLSGMIVISLGYPWVGSGFVGVDVIALAGVFIRGHM